MNKGIVYAASAYLLWGFFPLYFHALRDVSAVEILAHRIAWSFAVLAIVVVARREVRRLAASITPRIAAIYLAAAILLATNWVVYVWAVASGFVVESSLGYFINPLVSVLLGVIVLRERLRPLQWIPVGLAAVGVGVLTLSYGHVPWIALTLAVSFGTYGLVKKLAPLESLHGLALETTILAPAALVYIAAVGIGGSAAFLQRDPGTDVLMAFLGVMTVIPLLLFASGARRVPLTMLGLLQYTAPTLQFLIGVVVLGEPLTTSRIFGFAIIWTALALFSAEGFVAHRRSRETGARAAGSRADELAVAPLE